MQTMSDELLQPLRAYKNVLKKRHEVYTRDLFEELVKKSGIDVSENHITVQAYNEEQEKIKNIAKKLSKLRTLRTLMIFLVVAGAVEIIGCIVQKSYPWIALGAAVAAIAIYVWVKVLNPKVKSGDALKAEYEAKAKRLLDKAWEQMAPLNALFDSDMTRQLVQKTIPIVKIDRNFTVARYAQLRKEFGYAKQEAFEQISTVSAVSGEIQGNPYIIERYLCQAMGTEVYTGELYIEWTEYYTDSDGNECRIDRSETLHASVTKPKPYYYHETMLTYGNEAAPNLSFSHDRTHAEKMSDKQRTRYIKSEAKRIQKLARRDLTKGNASFTPLGNDEFDALFNATDRSNEMEFRLLFTPMAQKNMIELMTDSDYYGDDFNFRKHKMINTVAAEQADSWCMETSTGRYKNYDIDASLASFVNFNTEWFKRFYFQFAPLLSIPLYQQHKSHEFIYRRSSVDESNYTPHEAEILANCIGQRVFQHVDSATQAILKTQFVRAENDSDVVNVTAHSFRAVERCDYVSVFGGDGHWHDVPVYWYEYIPICARNAMEMRELGLNDAEFAGKKSEKAFADYLDSHVNRCAYCDGIFAGTLAGGHRITNI